MKKLNITFISFLLLSINSFAAAPAQDVIVIDDSRSLQINEDTVLTIDRRPVLRSDSRATEQFGTGFLSRTVPGFKARINYESNGANGNPGTGNSGDLTDINFMNSVIGPVTENSANSFQVLFVDLVIDADTHIEGIDNLSDIPVGGIVAASGMESEDGSVKVTRLEYFEETFPYWLITGDISNYDQQSFDIGGQHISIDLEIIQNLVFCGNQGLSNGTKVIVDLEPKDDYTNGDDLEALAVICYEDFDTPIDPPEGVFFNGEIEQINEDQTEIVVEGVTVIINEDTQILSDDNNNSTDLEVGMNVSVNGFANEENDTVIADFIIISGEEPIDPPGLPVLLFGEVSNVGNQSFDVDGQTVEINPATLYVNGTQSDLVDGAIVQVFALTEAPNGGLLAVEVVFNNDNPIDPPGDYVQIEGNISDLSDDHTQFNIGEEVILITEDTILFGAELADLENGMLVAADGERDGSNNIVANFVAVQTDEPTDPPGHVCLTGTITEVNTEQSQFTLDTGAIVNFNDDTEYVGGTLNDLIVGANVDVAGLVTQANNEVTAEIVFFVPDLPIEPPAFVFFSGFVSAIAEDGLQITVDDRAVNIDQGTEYYGGSSDNLVVGVEVQVEGFFNHETDEVDAQSITFPVKTVAAAAPVLPEDVTLSTDQASNGVITIMGIEVHQNELTWDFSEIFTNGLAEETTVSFFGYQDDDGTVWAYSVFDSSSQGNPNGGNGQGGEEIFLYGDISSLNPSLSVVNVNIETTESTIFFDENFNQQSEEDFMTSLTSSDSLALHEAVSYDRDTNTLTASVMFKQDTFYGTHPSRAVSRAEGDEITGSGIVTSVIEDVIYKSAF